MEVHSHSHTARKKWTHYLWEFLMLFLAVFCGFLAENEREHFVEHRREKQYMQSFLEDLQQDTIEINRVSLVSNYATERIDTLLILLRVPLSNDEAARRKVYAFARTPMGGEIAVFTQRTLSQLKNAGGLRLVREKEVATLISIYDSKIQYLEVVAKSLDEATTFAARQGIEIFDLNYYQKSNDGKYNLLDFDQKTIIKFSNYAQMVRNIFTYYENSLQNAKKRAIKLMRLIKAKYHLK